jgi:hypothetical protein
MPSTVILDRYLAKRHLAIEWLPIKPVGLPIPMAAFI